MFSLSQSRIDFNGYDVRLDSLKFLWEFTSHVQAIEFQLLRRFRLFPVSFAIYAGVGLATDPHNMFGLKDFKNMFSHRHIEE